MFLVYLKLPLTIGRFLHSSCHFIPILYSIPCIRKLSRYLPYSQSHIKLTWSTRVLQDFFSSNKFKSLWYSFYCTVTIYRTQGWITCSTVRRVIHFTFFKPGIIQSNIILVIMMPCWVLCKSLTHVVMWLNKYN